jgi:hypothetical protein
MRKVTVTVTSDETLMVEGRRPGQLDTWLRLDGKDVIAGETAEFQLKKGERLVIGDNSQEEMVYDPEQNASVRPSTQNNEDGRADRAAEASEEQKNVLKQKEEQEQARMKADAENKGAQQNANPDAGKQNPAPSSQQVRQGDPNTANMPSGNLGMQSSKDVKGK